MDKAQIEEIVKATGFEFQTVVDLLENGWVYDNKNGILVRRSDVNPATSEWVFDSNLGHIVPKERRS